MLCLRSDHYDCGAGFAGAGRAGTVYSEHGTDFVRCSGSGYFPDDCHAANPKGNPFGKITFDILLRNHYSGLFRAEYFCADCL